MKTIPWVATAVVVLFARPALGHEGGFDARGVVATADTSSVAVRGADGKEQRFEVTLDTRIVVAGRAARPSDLAPGMRAVVHGRKSGAKLEAVAVRASAPKGASSPPSR